MKLAAKIANLVFIGLLLLTSGCDSWRTESARNQKRFEALDKVDRTKIPVGSEFFRLYPDATIRYLDFSGSDFPGLSIDTTLFQRYTLNLRIPVFYSEGDAAVLKYGDPTFYVLEVQKIVPRDGKVGSVDYGDQQFQFGLDEWKKLNSSGGDFSVIGHKLKVDQPVEWFDLIKVQNQELSRKAEKHPAEQAVDGNPH